MPLGSCPGVQTQDTLTAFTLAGPSFSTCSKSQPDAPFVASPMNQRSMLVLACQHLRQGPAACPIFCSQLSLPRTNGARQANTSPVWRQRQRQTQGTCARCPSTAFSAGRMVRPRSPVASSLRASSMHSARTCEQRADGDVETTGENRAFRSGMQRTKSRRSSA